MKGIMYLLFLTGVINGLPKFYMGETTLVDLPLTESGDRAETMKLTYWTGYLETKECLRSALPCEYE